MSSQPKPPAYSSSCCLQSQFWRFGVEVNFMAYCPSECFGKAERPFLLQGLEAPFLSRATRSYILHVYPHCRTKGVTVFLEQRWMKTRWIRYFLIQNMLLNTFSIWNRSKHCPFLEKLPQRCGKCGWWSIRERQAYFCTRVSTQYRKLHGEELHGLYVAACISMQWAGRDEKCEDHLSRKTWWEDTNP
jgi:hypothetical protein